MFSSAEKFDEWFNVQDKDSEAEVVSQLHKVGHCFLPSPIDEKKLPGHRMLAWRLPGGINNQGKKHILCPASAGRFLLECMYMGNNSANKINRT